MANEYILFVDNPDALKLTGLTDDDIERSMYRAINYAADRGVGDAASRMRKQVNFPQDYLRGSSSRLTVTTRARQSKAEAVITGRFRPTSLARFATATKVRGGVQVAVRPGRARTIKNAFLMKLKSGTSDTFGNLGLAVRTARGVKPSKAYRPVKINDRLWLLYGPSVSQVFKSVRVDISPDTAIRAQQEFARLIEYELKK